jgi:hypothetical protein
MRVDFGRSAHRYCDGVNRRDFLKVGALTALGLTLPDLLRARAAAATEGKEVKKTSCILIWQGGGASHMDMWDPKPEAPLEFRGPFGTIPTNVSGVRLAEPMERTAKVMDKFSIIRSFTHPNSGHEQATHMMLTGYFPILGGRNEMPSYGSIVSKVRGPNKPGMPAYVTIPSTPTSSNAGYLGVAYNPFSVDGDPNNKGFQVRNLTLPGAVTEGRFTDRRALLGKLDTLARESDPSGLMKGMDAFKGKACELVTSAEARKAFDLSQEPEKLRDEYGRNTLGQSCLLARRLVEAGVTFVTINSGGWDTHANNFEELKRNRLPQFDPAWATLVRDLSDRGLLDSTLVMAFGEFGRTPRINPQAGRDHWPNAMSIALGGGGIKGGVVLGESDARGEYPKERPLSQGDLFTTMYTLLGMDPNVEYYNEANRPLKIAPGGEVIRELV